MHGVQDKQAQHSSCAATPVRSCVLAPQTAVGLKGRLLYFRYAVVPPTAVLSNLIKHPALNWTPPSTGAVNWLELQRNHM